MCYVIGFGGSFLLFLYLIPIDTTARLNPPPPPFLPPPEHIGTIVFILYFLALKSRIVLSSPPLVPLRAKGVEEELAKPIQRSCLLQLHL